MYTKHFLASCAKTLFVLATAILMSAVLSGCSKDDEPFLSSVILNGEYKKVLKAEYEEEDEGNFILTLYLSEDRKERLIFGVVKSLHMGKGIDLTVKETPHKGWYWSVQYFSPEDKRLVFGTGHPTDKVPTFTKGTLNVSGSPAGILTILLKDGQIIGTNGKTNYTLDATFLGLMPEYKP